MLDVSEGCALAHEYVLLQLGGMPAVSGLRAELGKSGSGKSVGEDCKDC